jgi:hypothetical protein
MAIVLGSFIAGPPSSPFEQIAELDTENSKRPIDVDELC